MPLLGNVLGAVGLDVGLSVNTSTSSGTSAPASTGAPASTNAPNASTNTLSSPVPVGAPIALWGIQTGETLFVNVSPLQGPTAWVPFVVRYVFADGNAVLTRDPDVVAYTGSLVVGENLRRKSETYNSTYPGP